MSKVTPLFRREVLEAQNSRAQGAILLVANRARRWLCLLYGAFAISTLLFSYFGSYTRTATVSGVVLPVDGVKRIVASAPGRIDRVMVSEGQPVARGQPLLALTSSRTNSVGANPDAQQSALLTERRASLQTGHRQQQAVQTVRVAAATRAIEDQQLALAQARQALALQQRRTQLAEVSAERYRQLAAGGHVAALALQDREVELLDQQQRSAELQRLVLEAQRQQRAARNARFELQAEAQREDAAHVQSLAVVEQELSELSARAAWLLVAPDAAVVSAVRVQHGDQAVQGQLLLALVNPAAPLMVELYAPSRAAGLLRAGQPVSLRYQAFPYQKYGQQRGTVRQVSGSALQPAELGPEVVALFQRTAEPLYRVSVSLASQSVTAGNSALRLQPGTLVDASVRLESRRLYQWLLAPLSGIGIRP